MLWLILLTIFRFPSALLVPMCYICLINNWLFWLDKLLYRHNPIKRCGVVFPASDILFGCCISDYDYCTVVSLMDNKSILYF